MRIQPPEPCLLNEAARRDGGNQSLMGRKKKDRELECTCVECSTDQILTAENEFTPQTESICMTANEPSCFVQRV